ncbi:MAG: ferritin-like domain-containing protein [Xenococcaceae cyanobacterium]
MISETSLNFYQKLKLRRRDWKTIQPSSHQQTLPEANGTLSKALALSQLEMPVADWIAMESQKHQFPKLLAELLALNIQDEAKHDRALNNLKAVFQVKNSDEREAALMVKRANELANIYSPVVVAGVLESSVFFVVLPIYRFLGGAGFRTVASDISNDEQIHVATNLQLASDLGYNRGQKLNNFREEVIDWLVSDLKETSSKYLSPSFWRESSNSLYHEGKAKNLIATKRAIKPAFFEINAVNLPIYN